MTWPMPPGQWNPGIAMAPDMSVGSYTPEQWAMMQQQSWQWAQWQQQYAQWQTQYGEKYSQQLQSMQAMSMAPPLPPSNMPPPAPPPPENPPPPPHENDQPLFGTSKAPTPVPPVYTNQTNSLLSNNMPSTSQKINQPTINTSESQQSINNDALKKLAEEERVFDIQFKKWEEEIEKWREDNVNHPDKRAYTEYEQTFVACREQLLERRQQMKEKKARLLSNVSPPANIKNTGNISTNIPFEQCNKSNNYTKNITPMQQSYKDNSRPVYNDRNLPQSQQYKMSQHNYNRGDVNRVPQDMNQSYKHTTENYDPIDSNNTFLPSSSSAKGIPGLDLVPEERPTFSNQADVIDITNDHDNRQQSKQNTMDQQTEPPNIGPDYSTISQGINNILGDEKIMNILSMVAGQKTGNSVNLNIAPPQLQPPSNNQWRNDYFDDRQPTDFRNQNDNNFTPHQQNRFSNLPHAQGHHNQRHDNRQDATQDQYSNNQGNHNMHLRNMPPQLMQTIAQSPRPLLPNLANKYPEQPYDSPRMGMQENRALNLPHTHISPDHKQVQSSNIQNSFNQRGLLDKREPLNPNNPHTAPNQRMLEQIEPRAMSPMKPKWVTDPLFTPSIIVEYEHKPLRLKARDFIEPVHTFDYNHISKDGEGVDKRKFEEEAEQLFARKPKQLVTNKDWNLDRHTRDVHLRDNRQLRHEVKNDYCESERGETFYQRRHDYRRHEDRERLSRFSDIYKEKEYDRNREARERTSGKDYDRNYERKDSGRDRDLGRDRDFGRDRDPGRDKDYGRDRDTGPYRSDLDRNRDNAKERDREYARDRYRDRKAERNRSHSRDTDSRKRGISKENEVSNSSEPKKSKTTPANVFSFKPKHVIMIDDILEPPGREMRPLKIVIVLRGPPGSGKSYLAKLIRDREAEHGGTARIMSIDDYFMQEGEIEEKDPTTGKVIKKPSLKYEYDESLEETYQSSLKRAFKRSLTDGYFSFLIFDAVNDQLKGYADIWNFARQNGFQVYICTMDLDPQVCFKRNIHNRKLEDIEVICSRFFPTPAHHLQLDATTLLQSASIPDVHMEDVSNEDIVNIITDEEPEVENSFSSKWEKMDDAAQLARLDGINKPLRPSQLSMEDYLHLDDWKPNTAKPGKKTVRWADLEERRQQEKMRAIGFVVGQTDWNRMTDPTMGSSALTQTKYIERVRRN